MNKKITHKIWVKIVALALSATLLCQQSAFARSYTANDDMKDWFTAMEGKDQAAIYVVGTVLSLVTPGIMSNLASSSAASATTATVTNGAEQAGTTAAVNAGAQLSAGATAFTAAEAATLPVAQAGAYSAAYAPIIATLPSQITVATTAAVAQVTQGVIVGGVVSGAGQIAVAAGADPKATAIIGGVVGGALTGGLNGGGLTGGFNGAIIGGTSAAAAVYVGEETNPILGSLAGMVTGALVQGALAKLNPGMTASGRTLSQEDADVLRSTPVNDPSTIPGTSSPAPVTSSPAPLPPRVCAGGSCSASSPSSTLPSADIYDTGNYSSPLDTPPVSTPDSPVPVAPVKSYSTLGPSGSECWSCSRGQASQSQDFYVKNFNTVVAPGASAQAQRASAIIGQYGDILRDVNGIPLDNFNLVTAAFKNLQTLGPGIFIQTAVQWAIYEALGKDVKEPWADPLIKMAGGISGAMANQAFGQAWAGTPHNPWGKPADLDFGAYMGKVFLTEMAKFGVRTGFNYLEKNITSSSFPRSVGLLVNAGEFLGSSLASSLVSLAYPTTPDFIVAGQRYGTRNIELNSPTFGQIFSTNLGDNFKEVLANTMPTYFPGANTGIGSAAGYLNYIQELVQPWMFYAQQAKGLDETQLLYLNANQMPFFHIASAFGGTLKEAAINNFGQTFGEAASNPFMPANYKMYLALIKIDIDPAGRVLKYHASIPHELMKGLENRKAITGEDLGKFLTFADKVADKVKTGEFKVSEQTRLASNDAQADREYSRKLYGQDGLAGYVGADSLPVSYSLDTYNLAGIPQRVIELRQERIFDVPGAPGRIIEAIMNNSEAKAAFNKMLSDDPELTELKGWFESGSLTTGIATFTNYLTVGSITERNRWGQELSTVYYRQSRGEKTGAAGILVPTGKVAQYFYGPFGKSLSVINDAEKGVKANLLSRYQAGDVYGRGASSGYLDLGDDTKGPGLSMMMNMPEVLSKTDISLTGLENLDAEKIEGILALPLGDGRTVGALIKDEGLANVIGALDGLVESGKLAKADAVSFVQGMTGLDKSGIAIKDLPAVISSLKEQKGKFFIGNKPKDFDMVRHVSFGYNLEAAPGEFEKVEVYAGVSGFQDGQATFNLGAGALGVAQRAYENNNQPSLNLMADLGEAGYLKNPLQGENSWANYVPGWFKNFGKGLEARQVTLGGMPLWFLKKAGTDTLYPALKGPYFYNSSTPVPENIRAIYGSMLLPGGQTFSVNTVGLGERLRHIDATTPQGINIGNNK